MKEIANWRNNHKDCSNKNGKVYLFIISFTTMKRAVLILVLLAILLAGCAQQAEEKPKAPSKETTAPATTPETKEKLHSYM
jgi:hypothetical protein